MDTTERILLSVNLDVAQLNANLTQVKSQILDFKQKISDTTKEIKLNGDANGHLTEQLVQYEAELRRLNGEQRNYQSLLDNTTKLNTTNAGSIQNLAAQAKLLTAQFNAMSEAERNEAGGQALQANLAGVKQQLIDLGQSVNDGRANVGNYAKSLQPLNQAVSESRQEHRDLTNAVRGATSAMLIISSVTGDNTKQTELYKDGMAALVVIENISAIKLGFVSAARAVDTVATKAGTVATEAATAATGAFATVQTFLAETFGISTVAARTLAVALTGLGIGALIVGVVAAVQAIQSFISSEDEAAEAAKRLNDQVRIQNDALKFVTDSNKIIDEERIKTAELQLQLDEKEGASALKLYQEKKHILDLQKEDSDAQFESAEEQFKTETDPAKLDELQKFLNTKNEINNQFALKYKIIQAELVNATKKVTTEIKEQIQALATGSSDANLKEQLQKLLVATGDLQSKAEPTEGSIIDRMLGTDPHQFQLTLKNYSEFAGQLGQITNSIFEGSTNARRADLADLQNQRAKGIITEQQYASQVAQIKRKQAIADKENALFHIVIETAQAIASDWYFPPKAIADAAVGAAEFAAVAAEKIPAFAKGGFVSGPGTSKSDSIPAWLSNGEFVMTAQAVKMFGPAISAMNYLSGGKKFADGGLVGSGMNDGGYAYNYVTNQVINNSIPQPQPKVYVSVTDINLAQNRVNVIQNRANI